MCEIVIIPFLNQKKIYFTHNKNSVHNIVRVQRFQQLLANKHHRLRDAKFGRVEVWVCYRTRRKKKTEKKQKVDYEPHRPTAARSIIVLLYIYTYNSSSETEAKRSCSHFVSEENTPRGLVTRQALNLT